MLYGACVVDGWWGTVPVRNECPAGARSRRAVYRVRFGASATRPASGVEGSRFGLVDARCGSMQFAPSLAARLESCVPQQSLTFQDHFEPIDTNDAQAAPQPYWDVRNTHRSLTPFANLL